MFVRKFEASDWPLYKAMRLEAIKLHAGNFGASYESEAAITDQTWQKMLSDEGQKYFGLYDADYLVGIGAVFAHRDEARTAILAAGYIRENYRGKGYSHLLYKARIDWAKDSELFDRIIMGHRDGNEASRRANKAFGFQYIGMTEKVFGDDTTAIHHNYEMRLR